MRACDGRSRIRITLLFLFGTGCGDHSRPDKGNPIATCTTEKGRLAFIVEGDTSVVDEYVRTDTLLRGTLRTRRRSFAWARYEVRFYANGGARSAHLEVGRAGTSLSDRPAREWRLTIDSGIVREVSGTGTMHQAAVRHHPVVPRFAPSIAMLQELLRRAPLDPMSVPETLSVFPMGGGSLPRTVVVDRLTPDTVTLMTLGNLYVARYLVDGCGRLLRDASPDPKSINVRVQ